MDPKATATVTSLLYALEWDEPRFFPTAMLLIKLKLKGRLFGRKKSALQRKSREAAFTF